MGRSFALLSVLGVMGAASTAAAQEPPAGETHEASQRFDAGLRLFAARNFEAALSEFQASYRVRSHPAILFNIGQTLMRLGRGGEAYETLERWIVESHAAGHRRREIEREIARLRPTLVAVELVVDYPGATITVDGRSRGTTPLGHPLYVDPGPHVIELSAPGKRPVRQELAAQAGDTVRLSLTLEDAPAVSRTVRIEGAGPGANVEVSARSTAAGPPAAVPEPAAAHGSVEVRVAAREAVVRIDEDPGEAAPRQIDLAPGTHRVGVSAPGRLPWNTSFSIGPGARGTVDLSPARPARVGRLWGWLGAGGAVVLGGATAVLGILALGQQTRFDAIANDLANRAPNDPAVAGLQSQGHDAARLGETFALGSTVALIAALLSAAASGAVFLLFGEEPARARFLGLGGEATP